MSVFTLTRPIARSTRLNFLRRISTLPNNPHIYVFPSESSPGPGHILSLLPTDPPNPSLAIGSTTEVPPTPTSLTENPAFHSILQNVLRRHAVHDPDVQAQARAMASAGGSTLGSGGAVFSTAQQTQQRNRDKRAWKSGYGGGGGGGRASKTATRADGGDGAGAASVQGGMGGGGRGGWIHVSDQRNPPDYGRIAWPEDIFGSVEVDGWGEFVGENGNYQESGTYRIVTREGILGLSPYLREKLVEELKELEKQQEAIGHD